MASSPAQPVNPQQFQRESGFWGLPRFREIEVCYFSWIGQPFLAGWPWKLPLLAALLGTAILRYTPLDVWISSLFYDPVTRTWPYFYSTVCTIFYRGGVYPAVALCSWGCVLVMLGIARRDRRSWLRAGLFLLAVLLIGPGMIVNGGLKQYWGRPRPHQLELFGGSYGFVPVGSPGTMSRHNSSFPSGHAAVAFYLMAPAFLARGTRPRLARALLFLGIAFGAAMSATRIVQGGHFASDVLWSAAIVYLTCVVCARIILSPRMGKVEPEAPSSTGELYNPTVAPSQTRALAA